MPTVVPKHAVKQDSKGNPIVKGIFASKVSQFDLVRNDFFATEDERHLYATTLKKRQKKLPKPSFSSAVICTASYSQT
jgi:hypothetical protein